MAILRRIWDWQCGKFGLHTGAKIVNTCVNHKILLIDITLFEDLPTDSFPGGYDTLNSPNATAAFFKFCIGNLWPAVTSNRLHYRRR